MPTETGRDCLVVGGDDPELVIAAHVDTIDPPWPAAAVVDGDVVAGLGSVDDKGGVVACLLAARALAAAGSSLEELGVAFAFPVDEERGGSGSRALAIALRPASRSRSKRPGSRSGWPRSGASTPWSISTAGAPTARCRSSARTRSTPRSRLINDLPKLELGRHEHELLGSSSAEIGSITAGTDFNTVPDRCSFRSRSRSCRGRGRPGRSPPSSALARSHGGRVELIEVTEPFETPPDSPLVRELDAATRATTGERSAPIGVPAWTDAHNFVVFGGAEAVVFGPGDFATAHTADEHIDAGRVAECAAIFRLLAERGWRR